jgi:hypothetical protein
MIKTVSLVALMLGWLIIPIGAVAWGDDDKISSAEKVLNGKGLTKDDRKFLLEGDAAAAEKYGQTKTVHADYQKALSRLAVITQYDESVQVMDAEKQGLQEQVNALQMQINSMGTGYGRMRQMANAQLAPVRQQQNQAKAQINQINTQLQASKAQAPKADERKTVPAEVDKTRQAYIESVRELDVVVAPLMAKYHELALDKTVTDALAELRRTTTKNFKLGPSDQVLAASKMIQDVKKNTGTGTKSSAKKKAKAKT